MFKKIIALFAVSFGVFFTAMMLWNVWSTDVQVALNGTLIGKLVLTTGMLSAAFIAFLVVLKLVEDRK
ncbi:MAG: hypothetical protein PHE77_03010 [Candidatus Pacebacteria bacterium]|nr:hypothetical protein [Candidatus Paceibacterota bacterium]